MRANLKMEKRLGDASHCLHLIRHIFFNLAYISGVLTQHPASVGQSPIKSFEGFPYTTNRMFFCFVLFQFTPISQASKAIVSYSKRCWRPIQETICIKKAPELNERLGLESISEGFRAVEKINEQILSFIFYGNLFNPFVSTYRPTFSKKIWTWTLE